MTTASTLTPFDQTTDAGFRAWVSSIITQLAAVGLTQTSDTGQINTSTVTRPGSGNTSAGYTIWQFNDSLQGTSPIYFKLEFGSGSAAANPQMWVTVGTGTNGAGTINATGASSRLTACAGYAAGDVGGGNYYSRFCYNPTYGSLAVVWQIGNYSSTSTYANINLGSFYICRSTNTTGVPTATAYQVITNNDDAGDGGVLGFVQSWNYSTNTRYPTATSITKFSSAVYNAWAPIWNAIFPSNDGNGNYQVTPSFMVYPAIQFNPNLLLGLNNEIPMGSTISTTVMGSTPRTYLAIGSSPSNFYVGFYSNQFLSALTNAPAPGTLLMLWE